jgi:hypothetical protein
MAHMAPTFCPCTTNAQALVQQGAQQQRSADECAAVPITPWDGPVTDTDTVSVALDDEF